MIIEVDKLLKQRNLSIIIAISLLISNLAMSFLLLFSSQEVVLVPNSLKDRAVISKNYASKQYIEAVTRDVVGLVLNITPTNTEYVEKEILKITHPIFYGKLKSALLQRSKDVTDRKISNYFFPKSMQVNENKVYVSGNLKTFLGKKMMSSDEKKYFIEYKIEGFRPMIVAFEEVRNVKE